MGWARGGGVGWAHRMGVEPVGDVQLSVLLGSLRTSARASGQVCRASGSGGSPAGGQVARRGALPTRPQVPSTSEAPVCFCEFKKRFLSPPMGDGAHAHTHTRLAGRPDPLPCVDPVSHSGGTGQAGPAWPLPLAGLPLPPHLLPRAVAASGSLAQQSPGGISPQMGRGRAAFLPVLLGEGGFQLLPPHVPSPREAPA